VACANPTAADAEQANFLCSASCQNKFEAAPETYVEERSVTPTAKPAPEGTVYTCPTRSTIHQPGPGNCPICGMALETEIATLQEGPNVELVDMTRRFG